MTLQAGDEEQASPLLQELLLLFIAGERAVASQLRGAVEMLQLLLLRLLTFLPFGIVIMIMTDGVAER